MKQIGILLCLICLASKAWADLPRVRDELLTTADRSCGVHYLTHDNTTGWYLTEVEGSCPAGVLEGAGIVTIRNAFGKPVGQINGFFTHGYWTGHQAINVPLEALLLHDEPEQTLVLNLGHEDRLNIRYLGKLTADRRKDRTYGPFVGCRPAQILAVTPDTDLFEDEAVQHELINSAINRVKTVCPDTDQIYFYASETENPDNKEIAFFADINLESRQIRVRRLPSSNRSRDILASPAEVMPIPQPREVRRETGLPVVRITPIKPEDRPRDTRSSLVPKKPIDPPSTPPTPVPVYSTPMPNVASAPTPQISVAPEVVTSFVAAPVESAVPENLDEIPALLTAARLLKQPVAGKAMIHVSGFDEAGNAVVDEPVFLHAKGQSLSLGWGVVEGLFSRVPVAGSGPSGFVQVDRFTPISSPGSR